MITEQQNTQQFEAADLLEAAVLQGRWRGIVPDKLWLVEVEQGINIEVELDRVERGLRLLGIPDMTPDGQYQLLLESDRATREERLVACDQIFPAICQMLDGLIPPREGKQHPRSRNASSSGRKQ